VRAARYADRLTTLLSVLPLVFLLDDLRGQPASSARYTAVGSAIETFQARMKEEYSTGQEPMRYPSNLSTPSVW